MNQLTIGSLFAGIGGFDLGFERAGFATRWACEIDEKAQAVLRFRFPNASLHDDVCAVGAHNLEPVDIVTFGSPCQDLSIAGKRKGLAGERSGLFHEAVRVIRELRELHGKPDFAIWENVPGAFSSNEGRDFAAVIDALADIGARDVAWRVLDSRFFGVAQRRRRVFLVADFGGERASEVLAQSQGVSGYSEKSRQKGKIAPRAVGEGARASSVIRHRGAESRPDFFVMSDGQAGSTVSSDGTAPTLTCLHEAPIATYCLPTSGTLCAADGPRGVSDQYAHEDKLIAMPICESVAGTLNTLDGRKWGSNQWVREGKWVAMPKPKATSDAMPIPFDTTQITHAENRSNPQPGAPCHPLAAQGHPPAIAYNINLDDLISVRESGPGFWMQDTVSGTLRAEGENRPSRPSNVIGYNIYPGRPDENGPAKLSAMETQIANAVTVTEHARTTDRGTRIVEASPASIVRRLTPVECCRLQGFPDDWNAQGIDKAGKVIQMADSSRYKQLGNAVTVNVANWLAVRIAAVLRQDERPASTGQIAE